MSFARFSSDDHKSCIYAYVDSQDGLITVHTAGNKILGIEDLELPDITADIEEEFNEYVDQVMQRNSILSDFIRRAQRETLDPEYAGKTYRGLSVEEALELLDTIQQHGFYVPERSIEKIKLLQSSQE